jgi:hypothetical protein
VEELLETTDHNGFPVVVSMESQYLVGFVLRRDLSLAIANAKSRLDGISSDTLILFTNHAPAHAVAGSRDRFDETQFRPNIFGIFLGIKLYILRHCYLTKMDEIL